MNSPRAVFFIGTILHYPFSDFFLPELILGMVNRSDSEQADPKLLLNVAPAFVTASMVLKNDIQHIINFKQYRPVSYAESMTEYYEKFGEVSYIVDLSNGELRHEDVLEDQFILRFKGSDKALWAGITCLEDGEAPPFQTVFNAIFPPQIMNDDEPSKAVRFSLMSGYFPHVVEGVVNGLYDDAGQREFRWTKDKKLIIPEGYYWHLDKGAEVVEIPLVFA